MGDKMPSGRELAIKYKINPNTANRIYREMEVEGLCFTKRGLGTFVTEDRQTLDRIRSEMAEELLDHFIHGMKLLSYSEEELCRMISERYNEGEAK